MSENIEHNELVEGEIVTSQEPQPGQLVTLKNGAIYDHSVKRIVANPGGGTAAITQATASDYHEMAKRKRVAIALEGMKRATGSDSGREAAAILAQTQAQVAMDPKNRNTTQAYRALMMQADLWPERSGTPQAAGLTISAHFSPESALQLVQLLDKMRT